MAWSERGVHTFQWEIHSNLSPAIKFKAGFYVENFNMFNYQVIFQPLYRRDNMLLFSFTLLQLQPSEELIEDISFSVAIIHKKKLISVENKPHYIFNIDNGYSYNFMGNMVLTRQLREHHLTIKIDFTVKPYDSGSVISGYPTGLKHLSRDMKKLLQDSIATDMCLKAKDSDRRFFVHSYILDVRFNKFFESHTIDEENEYKVDISRDVLSDILEYVYTGIVREGWPASKDEAYRAELLYVIDKFQLNEIYKNILECDLRQKRVTRNPSCTKNYIIPLKIVDGRPVNNDAFTDKIVVVGPEDEDKDGKKKSRHLNFELDLKFQMENQTGNWLSFSLHSYSEISVYAEVNLELVKKMDGLEVEVISFHAASFTLGPEETEDSGRVLFLGCFEHFERTYRTKTHFSIRCVLNVSSTLMIQELECYKGLKYNTVGVFMFRLLSIDMGKVRSRRKKPTFKICSKRRTENSNWLSDFMHEGIFKARLPRWWKAINLNEDDDIPSRVQSNLEYDSFQDVIEYIYTGQISASVFKNRLVNRDIRDFAEETGLPDLEESIRRMSIR